MKADFTLYTRQSKKYRKIYYVRFRHPDTGERMTAISTGCTSKSDATNWALNYLKEDRLFKKTIKFGEYVENWFEWDKCRYIAKRLENGYKMSKSYADQCYKNLHKYILPYFMNKDIEKINVSMIEAFQSKLKANIRLKSNSSINVIMNTLRVIMKEAYREDLIDKNPCERIPKLLLVNSKIKGTFTTAEIDKLFKTDTIKTVWNGDLYQYTFNLIAVSTGMRQGEILALQFSDIKDGYIQVSKKWNRQYGIEKPKNDSARVIPIPDKTAAYIEEVKIINKFSDDPDSFIFAGLNKDTPIDHKVINKYLYKALENIGISEEVRNKRVLTFHSWRHTFNTLMRGNISDYKLRQLTGHKTEVMTDHYTHFDIEQYQDVQDIQNKLLSKDH